MKNSHFNRTLQYTLQIAFKLIYSLVLWSEEIIVNKFILAFLWAHWLIYLAKTSFGRKTQYWQTKLQIGISAKNLFVIPSKDGINCFLCGPDPILSAAVVIWSCCGQGKPAVYFCNLLCLGMQKAQYCMHPVLLSTYLISRQIRVNSRMLKSDKISI